MIIKLEDYYFSQTLKWTLAIASTLLTVYLIVMNHNSVYAIILVLISMMTFTVKSTIEINLEKKRILDSFTIMWLGIKSYSLNFDSLRNIRLEKERHTYTANSRGRTAQTDFNEYIGSLVFDDKHIEISRKVSYQPFIEEMNRIANELTIPIDRRF